MGFFKVAQLSKWILFIDRHTLR